METFICPEGNNTVTLVLSVQECKIVKACLSDINLVRLSLSNRNCIDALTNALNNSINQLNANEQEQIRGINSFRLTTSIAPESYQEEEEEYYDYDDEENYDED